jgi:hypothetical protein
MSIKQEIKTAYSKLRNLHFRASEPLGPAELKTILQEVFPNNGSYNNFKPSLLDKFPPNSQIYMAREGSVCLYVEKIAGLPSAEDVSADECDDYGDEIRYWWD